MSYVTSHELAASNRTSHRRRRGETLTTTNQGGVTRTLSFSYLPAGPRGSITHPGGTIFTAEYDCLNRLTQLREGTVAVPAAVCERASGALLTAFTYDQLGRIATRSNNS